MKYQWRKSSRSQRDMCVEVAPTKPRGGGECGATTAITGGEGGNGKGGATTAITGGEGGNGKGGEGGEG